MEKLNKIVDVIVEFDFIYNVLYFFLNVCYFVKFELMNFLWCYICGGVVFGLVSIVGVVFGLMLSGNRLVSVRYIFIYYEVIKFLIGW